MGYSVCRSEEAEARRVQEDWGSLSWLAGRKLGNARGITFGRVVIGKGKANPRHRHPNCEEVLHLLRGRLEHTCGDEKAVLEPGDTIVIGEGEFHNALSTGLEDAEMIVAYSSGERGFELET